MANLFDDANAPETEPTTIVACDQVKWKRTDLGTDYPNTDSKREGGCGQAASCRVGYAEHVYSPDVEWWADTTERPAQERAAQDALSTSAARAHTEAPTLLRRRSQSGAAADGAEFQEVV